jgi:hypothetical protein
MDLEHRDLQDLTNRVERLERKNQKLKWLGRLLFVGFAGFALIGALPSGTVQRTIEAERFTVKDTDGNPRASWGVGSDGRVTLGFAEKNGKTRITLSVEPDGSPVLYFYGKGETSKVLLHVNNNDSPELIFLDRRGKKRMGLTVDEIKGSAGIILSDTLERRRASFIVTDEGLPAILFIGDSENAEMVLGQSKNGPLLSVSDRQKNTRIALGNLTQGPSLRFWDEKGVLIRAVP